MGYVALNDRMGIIIWDGCFFLSFPDEPHLLSVFLRVRVRTAMMRGAGGHDASHGPFEVDPGSIYMLHLRLLSFLIVTPV